MRLFLAIEPGKDAEPRIARAVAELQHAFGERASALRWSPPQNVHVTLHFLGEVNDAGFEQLRVQLGDTVAVAPFDARSGPVELFPAGRQPRVLWLPIEKGREAFIALHREIGARIGRAGFAVEQRPYTPHLTLARVRDSRHAARGLAAPLHGVRVDALEWTVDHVTLFKSELSSASPRYEPLHRIALAAV